MTTLVDRRERDRPAPAAAVRYDRVFLTLMGLIGTIVPLQAVWAGMFLAHDGERDAAVGWIDVVLVLESYLGGLIRSESKDALTAVHVPLAMALMGLVGWLPLRARRR